MSKGRNNRMTPGAVPDTSDGHATDAAHTTGLNRITGGLVGLFLTAIFGTLFVQVIFLFVERQASLKWPSVQGIVKSAALGGGVIEHNGPRGPRASFRYYAVVVYQYTIRDQEYTSKQLGFGPKWTYSCSFPANALVEQYREKQQVTVYYDPANPKNAVLQREIMLDGYMKGSIGLLGVLCGLRLIMVSLMPTMASAKCRMRPWTQLITWPDLSLTVGFSIALVLSYSIFVEPVGPIVLLVVWLFETVCSAVR